MKHYTIKQNGYICAINAAAMVLDQQPVVIECMLGHDGKEVLYPDIDRPDRARGVHSQELVDIALKLNIALVQRDCEPVADHCGNERIVYTREVGSLVKPYGRPALIAGLNGHGNGHAIAYNPQSGLYYDPNGPVSNVPTIRAHTAWIAFEL